jgi:hypothetical protein
MRIIRTLALTVTVAVVAVAVSVGLPAGRRHRVSPS